MLPLFLQVGDLLVLAEKRWEHLIYQMGDSDVINYVIKKGEVVCQQQIKYLVSSRVVFTNQSLIKQTPKRQIGLQRLRVWIRLGLNCFTGSGSHLSFFQTLVVQKCTKIIKHCRTYSCFFYVLCCFYKGFENLAFKFILCFCKVSQSGSEFSLDLRQIEMIKQWVS